MKLLIINVSGMGNHWVKRSDLAHGIFTVMETGCYYPVFPVFPALTNPALATYMTGARPQEHGVLFDDNISGLNCWCPDLRRLVWPTANVSDIAPLLQDVTIVQIPDLDAPSFTEGPRAIPDIFKSVDTKIGELAKVARDLKYEIAIVSDYAVVPVAGAIDLTSEFPQARVHHQVASVNGNPQEIAPAAKAVDKGIKVLCTLEEKEVYGVNHPGAGDVVLISPPKAYFGAPGRKGSHGALPISMDDYAAFICSVPVDAFRGRPFVTAVDVGRALAQLYAR